MIIGDSNLIKKNAIFSVCTLMYLLFLKTRKFFLPVCDVSLVKNSSNPGRWNCLKKFLSSWVFSVTLTILFTFSGSIATSFNGLVLLVEDCVCISLGFIMINRF